MSNSIWAIPDIHGRSDLLNLLLLKLGAEHGLDLTHDELVFLGDMIDRGLDSKDVIERVRRLEADFPEKVTVLAGNHEYLAIKAQPGCGSYDDIWLWQVNGGGETIASFNGPMPDEITKWLIGLPLFYETDEFFFSHAPVPIEEQRRAVNQGKPFTFQELTWTYHEPEDQYARRFDGKIGVCGHIHALRRGIMEPRLYPHYIFADAGAGCSSKAPLVAIECNSRKIVYAWPDELKAAFPQDHISEGAV